MEASTRGGEDCGLLTSFASCVVRGLWRRDSPARRPCGAFKSERGCGGENARAGEQQGPERAAAQCLLKRRRLHWPSAARADPAASSVAPQAMALDFKPVQGDDTGVGVVLGADALSASLPPVAFAGGVPPEANAMLAQKRCTKRAVKARKQR
eukprot:806158-Pleurochrysis_carterae.AAC.2